MTPLDPTRETIAEVLTDTVGKAACAAIFDSVGEAETVQEALPLLAELGTYVNLAVQDITIPLNLRSLGSERTMASSSNARYREEREAHELIRSGAVDVATMITHRFPLEEFQQAFDLLLREPKEAYKVVFTMD